MLSLSRGTPCVRALCRWGCREGATHTEVPPSLRSPCVCQPPPPARVLVPAVEGALLGLLLTLLALACGTAWDAFERRSERLRRHAWRARVAAGGALSLLGLLVDLGVTAYLLSSGRWGYAAAAACILLGYLTACGVLASADTPLRPAAGDVVQLKRSGAEPRARHGAPRPLPACVPWSSRARRPRRARAARVHALLTGRRAPRVRVPQGAASSPTSSP